MGVTDEMRMTGTNSPEEAAKTIHRLEVEKAARIIEEAIGSIEPTSEEIDADERRRELAMQREVHIQWKENMTKQKEEHGEGVAIKFDQEKLMLELLPVRPIEDIAGVLTFGAKKYSERNWEQGFNYSRTYGALQRHLHAWYKGEDIDPESGLSHLSHAGCCLMFLLEFAHSGKGTDDRVKYVDKTE